MEEWACVFSFVILVSSTPPPFLKSNEFGIDFFFIIDNKFRVSEVNVEVPVVFVESQEWEQAEKSRSSIVSCL